MQRQANFDLFTVCQISLMEK